LLERALVDQQLAEAVVLLGGSVAPLHAVRLEDLRPLVHPVDELLVGGGSCHWILDSVPRDRSATRVRSTGGRGAAAVRARPWSALRGRLGVAQERRRPHVHLGAEAQRGGTTFGVQLETYPLPLAEHAEQRPRERVRRKVELARVGLPRYGA